MHSKGHTAIMKSTDTSSPFDVWSLEWDRVSIAVSLGAAALDGQVKEIVVQEDRRKPRRYMIFVHAYTPDRAAVDAYEAHAKRAAPNAQSEVTLFFELDSAGVAKRSSGLLHAVLPTKIKTGVAAHLHGSWLLSVDRQSLQSLTENAWNACCLCQYSELFVLVLRWLPSAAAKATSRNAAAEIVKAAFGILPTDLIRTADAAAEERYRRKLEERQRKQQQRGQGRHRGSSWGVSAPPPKPKPRLIWPAFETELDMQAVEHALATHKLAPVWARKTVVAAAEGGAGAAATAVPATGQPPSTAVPSSKSVLGFATTRDLMYAETSNPTPPLPPLLPRDLLEDTGGLFSPISKHSPPVTPRVRQPDALVFC